MSRGGTSSVIGSKSGYYQYVVVAATLFFLWSAVLDWQFYHSDRWLRTLTKVDAVLLVLLPAFVLLLLVAFLVYSFSFKVEIDQSGVTLRDFFQADNRKTWTELEGIDVPPFFGGVPGLYTLVLRFVDGAGRRTSITVPTLFFRNGRLVTRAILEAALQTKPVPVYGGLISSFGWPPYGVFSSGGVADPGRWTSKRPGLD